MNLTEIKNMDKNELIEYLDLYQCGSVPRRIQAIP